MSIFPSKPDTDLAVSKIDLRNVDLTKFLLKKNANPNIISSYQHTPLMIIIEKLYLAEQNKEYENFYKSFAILNLLLENSKLDISYVNALGKTAVNYATEYNLDWLIRMFYSKNR